MSSAMEHLFNRLRVNRRSLAFAVGAFALAACASEPAPPPAVSAERAGLSSYRYVGASGESQVARERGGDGTETLNGSTELPSRANRSVRLRIAEAVTLDARGRLRRADIVITSAGTRTLHVELDESTGSVRIERAGSASVDWNVPVDAPWVYAPAGGGDGQLSATPVAAWVALRGSRGVEAVRVIEPERQVSHLVAVDQVVVPTEKGNIIVLGEDGVDADGTFVEELRLFRHTLTLSRVAALDLGA